MLRTFSLPDVGEGLVEADILVWRVAVGEHVEVNDPLVEIETAKSVVELPSPWSGTVQQLLVEVGETVAVGAPIIEIDEAVIEGAAPGEFEPPETTQAPAESEPGSEAVSSEAVSDNSEASDAPAEPTLVGYGAKDSAATRRPRRPIIDDAALARRAGTDGVRAKPPVRRLAKDQGIDLREVEGTGLGGIVTRDDVEAVIAGSARAGSSRRFAVKGVRKATASNVLESVSTHVHVTEWVTIDVTETMEFVGRIKRRPEFAELRVSPLLLCAKAVTLALHRNPEINASWDEENQEIIQHDHVNLGIAAATPRGLMVPNIKGADDMSLVELCQAFNTLVTNAREGKLQPSDHIGGTFTITNVGVFGIDGGTPVINGHESAILCMGSIQRRPWVMGSGDDERIEPRSICTLALSFDHRNIDGELGSRFLADVAAVLGDPALALLH